MQTLAARPSHCFAIIADRALYQAKRRGEVGS
jgi:hypothetical protein